MTTDMQALKTQIEVFRSQTVATLKHLSELMTDSHGTQVLTGLQKHWVGLDKDNYRVLVLGEANRGKSSFINALLGRELLPVGITITTSQIYCIRSAQKEAYRLRYKSAESQRTVDITYDEFREYGTMPAGQKRLLRHSLDGLYWIEADIPTHFLPEGIALLDTPGVDTTVTSHTKLTEKNLPEADAAIFLLDSQATVTRSEMGWIERILQVTPLIFFVQPMTRERSKEDRLVIMNRHKEELGKRFGSRLKSIQIWPFSSTLLLAVVNNETRNIEEKQSQQQIEISLKKSGQPDLVDALTVFLFNAAGIDRCSTALLEACFEHKQAKEKLQNSLATFENGSQSEHTLLEAREKAKQQEEHLQKEWGPDGKKRKHILKSVQDLIEYTKDCLQDLSKSGGDLEKIFRKEIKAAQSSSTVNDLGKSLFGEVDKEWEKQCRKINKEFQNKYNLIVFPLSATLVSPDLKLPDLSSPLGEVVKVKVDLVERLKQLQEGFTKGEVVGTAIVAAVLTHLLFPVTLPVTIISVGVTSAFSAIQGWKDVADKQVEDARKSLDDYFTQIVQDTSKNLWAGQEVFEGKGQVDYRLEVIKRNSQKSIEEAINKLLAEARDECIALDKQINSNEQERAANIQALKKQLADWQKLDAPMQKCEQQLDAINSIFTTFKYTT